MKSKHSQYELVDQNDREGSASNFVSRPRPEQTRIRQLLNYVVLLVSSLSVALNVFFIVHRPSASVIHKDVSIFAGLERDTPKAIIAHEEYINTDDLNATSDSWAVLSGDPGVVALSDEYAAEQNLPHALRFPWDENKGVFLLQGFHNLHCLRTIYRSLINFHLGRPQHIALVHILHCMDELRQDVICNADDTPRYAGFQDPPGTGKGQVKMCRDWSKLEQWALENTACFHHEDETPDAMRNRFKSCPDGRKLWPPEEDM